MFHSRDLRDSLRPFARLHSPDQHEIFVQGLLSKFNKRIKSLKYYLNWKKEIVDADIIVFVLLSVEHFLKKEIVSLQEYRSAGICTRKGTCMQNSEDHVYTFSLSIVKNLYWRQCKE